MRYYVRAEIERFLRAVDRALKRPATVIIIGGGAAALKYRIDDPTTDIDTFNALGTDLRRAIDAARKATGLAMPFEHYRAYQPVNKLAGAHFPGPPRGQIGE